MLKGCSVRGHQTKNEALPSPVPAAQTCPLHHSPSNNHVAPIGDARVRVAHDRGMSREKRAGPGYALPRIGNFSRWNRARQTNCRLGFWDTLCFALESVIVAVTLTSFAVRSRSRSLFIKACLAGQIEISANTHPPQFLIHSPQTVPHDTRS